MQNRCVLTVAQIRDQYDSPVRELERIVVHVAPVRVDLPEPSHLLPEFPKPQTRQEAAKDMLALNLVLKRNLCAGKKAYCHVRLSGCREAASAGVAELRCYQFVTDQGGARCDVVKTVIAH